MQALDRGHTAIVADLQSSIKDELCLAFLGFGGAVFEVKPSQGASARVQLSKDLAWLSETDRAQLKDLIGLGSFYQTLSPFCSPQHCFTSKNSATRQALSDGLSEVLHVYREAILEVQQRCRHSTTLHITALHVYLERFKTLMPALAHLVHHITEKDLQGCQILHALANLARQSTAEVAACTTRLQWHCFQPLRKHVLAWMLHGELYEGTADFFVSYKHEGSLQQQGTDAGSENAGKAARLDWPKDRRKWHNFRVDHSALPPGMSSETAAGILFVGQVAWLHRKGAATAGDRASFRPVAPWSQAAANEVAAMFNADCYDGPRLGRCVAAARIQAAGVLWGMLVEGGQLQAHLQALKAFYLGGSGDFLAAFLHQVKKIEQHSPGPNTTALLVEAWQEARAASTAAADPLLDKFKIELPMHKAANPDAHLHERLSAAAQKAPKSLAAPAYDSWDGLRLKYTAEEPINQIIPDTVVKKYNVTWQLLAQMSIWQHHHMLSYILNCLLKYFQTDVVDVQSCLFGQRMAAMDTLGGAQRAHAHFIDTVTAHAFLDEPKVMEAISGVLVQCRALSSMVQYWSHTPAGAARNQGIQVKEALANLLGALKTLQGMSRSRAPSLGTLVSSLELCIAGQ
ncbi:hypothetical protein WJX73_008471 [Symbiochloris irregularis]|uniref:Gamma-tubulin complex component n=1 Tax=Symbiochloris irregularis TaxID=706552 RepID=A0AAW1PLR1_9CHLO